MRFGRMVVVCYASGIEGRLMVGLWLFPFNTLALCFKGIDEVDFDRG